jgi:membrane protease YdiL (CAAX protease family)
MQTLILALLLAAVLAFFLPAVQNRVRGALHARPAALWAVPFLLVTIFSGAAALAGAFSFSLAVLVLGYTAAPVVCAWTAGAGFVERPAALDFVAILLLWLPLEFAAGARLVPRPAQGFLHSVAYGIAIFLGLVLFTGFRSFAGMKYNLPRRRSDFGLPVAAFAITAPVLMVVGIAIGFIPLPHGPGTAAAGGRMAGAFGVILAGTALPEEILFRSLIQNLIMLRFGASWRTLLAASLIFGCAHLDNGPQPLPNWRYMILATIAGVAYGMVFRRASTVLSSAALHAMVDWTKHFFF